MKTSITIVFLILYGVALIRPAFPLLEYHIQMETYLEQCANKKRPELHCNGQCILMQKLKALNVETQEPSAPAPAKINFDDYPIGFVERPQSLNLRPTNSDNLLTIACWSMSSSKHIAAIFHPPVRLV